MTEAKLEDVGSGRAPVTPGWFVVNAGEAAWLRHAAFGGRCVFESSRRVLERRPEAEPQHFPEYPPPYYATFWLDPFGFMLEAVCHHDRA